MKAESPLSEYCDVGMLLRAPIRTRRDIDQLRKVTSRGRARYYELNEQSRRLATKSHEDTICASVDAERLLRACTERERYVVFAYLALGLTMKKIGIQLGVTECRVSQLFKEALYKMRKVVEGKK